MSKGIGVNSSNMPGGEWAGRTIPEIKSAIGTSPERARQVTGIVRSVLNGPDRDAIREQVGEDEVIEIFFQDLAHSLEKQPGSTIEERWNNLVEDYGLPEITEKGVYAVDSEVYLAFGGGSHDNDNLYHMDTIFEGPSQTTALGRSLLKYGRNGVFELEKIPEGLLVDGEQFEPVGRFGHERGDEAPE